MNPNTSTPDLASRRAVSLPSALALLVTLAAALILAGWQLDRTYWNDEAWGVDFASRSNLLEVWRDSIAQQLPGAPGYLAMLHAAEQVHDGRPWVYRVPTIAAGILMLFAVVVITRRWASSWIIAGMVAVVLLANPFIQQYFAEAKQYMGDAAFTLALFAATRWWMTTGKGAAAVVWTTIAALGVTMSFGFWFALAACGPLVLVVWVKRRDRTQVIRTAIAGVISGGAGAAVYFLYARAVASGQGGMGFWQQFFWPRDLGLFASLWNDWSGFLQGSWVPYSVPGAAMLAVAFIGLAVWLWRDPVTGAAAVLTLLITIAANLAQRWPMAIRVNLPVVIVLHLACAAIPLTIVGVLMDRKAGRLKPPCPSASAPCFPRFEWISLLALVALTATTLYKSRDFTHDTANIRPLLAETARRGEAGDQVILDWAAKVNQRLEPAPIQGTVLSVDWTNDATLEADYGAVIRPHRAGRTFVVSTIVNHERAAVWDRLGESLRDAGTFEKVWSDKSRRVEVAIYMFTPR